MPKPICPAEAHRAQVEAGEKLNAQGLGRLVLKADKKAFEGNWSEAAAWFRRALLFSKLLLGEEHVWTASLSGRLANALEKSKEAMNDEEVASLWECATGFFTNENKKAESTERTIREKASRIKRQLVSLVSLEDLKDGKAPRRGHQAKPLVISLKDLTPRSALACERAKINPKHLQHRDFHSFHKPGLTFEAQVHLHDQYEASRQRKLEEALHNRWEVNLEQESKARKLKYEEKVDREKQSRKRKLQANGKLPRRAKNDPKPILSFARKSKTKHKGAFHEATSISMSREICCPSCQTVYNFQDKTCRMCHRLVDWEKVIDRSDKTQDSPLASVNLVNPTPLGSSFPVIYSAFASDPRGVPLSEKEALLFIGTNEGATVKSRLAKLGKPKNWADSMHRGRNFQLRALDSVARFIEEENLEEIRFEAIASDPSLTRSTDLSKLTRRLDFARAGSQEGVLALLEGISLVSPSQTFSIAGKLEDSFSRGP